MKEIKIAELKDLQVDILRYVHEFCEKNSINYSLAFGTLLGAIRHHGYIPWDDDIDIMMLREDYERFLNLFSREQSIYKVVSPQSSSCYYAPYANVIDSRTVLLEKNRSKNEALGVKIDIFPIDLVPENPKKRKKLFRKVGYLRLLIDCRNTKFSKDKKIVWNILSMLVKTIFVGVPFTKMLDKIAKKSGNNNSGSSLSNAVVWCPRGERGCFKTNDFSHFYCADFESERFMIIEGYDDYLKANYSDYMQLPPVEERSPKHDFIAYWK